MRLVFVDIETGGFDEAVHPITQIAAVAVDQDLRELDSFEVKLQFDLATCDPEAMEMNMFDPDLWAVKAVAPRAALQSFAAFLQPFRDVRKYSKESGREYFVAQLVGHNAANFDWRFLKRSFDQAGEFLPAQQRVLCTCQRAAFYFQERPWLEPPASMQLATLADYFEVDRGRSHDALDDCRAAAGVYRAIVADESLPATTDL